MMSVSVELFEKDFHPFAALEKQQAITSAIGAQSVFVGYMRDFREQFSVDQMEIIHYPPMTIKQLTVIARQVVEQYHLQHVYLAHRVGEVFPTSPLVVIASVAAHRTQAITATAELLERLKSTAPFWKKEQTLGQTQWVKANTAQTLTGDFHKTINSP